MKYKIGELVRWVEDYAGGDIVKDAGIGIILGLRSYQYADLSYKMYTVYRSKHKDVMQVSGGNVSKMLTKEKRRNK
tara:strand:+ start:942 stop:1169 length:228 start_codon:yes stop_codon:yes gene_type:complete